MNGCADNVILMSQFASGVPYIVGSDVVIVQAIVFVQYINRQTR